MSKEPKDMRAYDIAADHAPLNEYLYPWQQRRKKPSYSTIPGNTQDPRGTVYRYDMLVWRHPLATTATYDERHQQGEDPYDPYEVLKVPQDIKLTLPNLDSHLLYKINQRRSLMISAYLAISLPITALVLMRVFTTSLVPLDPLFDFVVVFFMACVLANVVMFAHNHVDSVTKEMTAIAHKATSVEMKKLSEPVETPIPKPTPSEDVHGAYRAVVSEFLEAQKPKNISPVPQLPQIEVQEPVTSLVNEVNTSSQISPPPASVSKTPPPVGRLKQFSSHAKNLLSFKKSEVTAAQGTSLAPQPPSRTASLASLFKLKK